MIAIKLNAGHDRNGNPRRVYVVLSDDGEFVDAIDEGYRGKSALRGWYPDVPIGPTFDTTPSEYRALKKFGEEQRAGRG